jgi:hypothetical protein
MTNLCHASNLLGLFEGDQDIDVALQIDRVFDNVDFGLTKLINQTDMLAPPEARSFYESGEYKLLLGSLIAQAREKLDSGLGDQLLAELRSQEASHDNNYRLIIAGALMMRAGAKIKPDDLQYIRDLVPRINSNHSYVLPIFDHGFRGPGRVQFLAALDNYVPGTPRDFHEPSCFRCGKVEADLNSAPKRCSSCQMAWYCNRVRTPSHSNPVSSY